MKHICFLSSMSDKKTKPINQQRKLQHVIAKSLHEYKKTMVTDLRIPSLWNI